MNNNFNKFPWTNLHGFNLDWVIEKVKECISTVESMAQAIAEFPAKYETKENITTARKLSPTGNFTGTWFGEEKSSIDAKILEGLTNYQMLINYLIANPQLAWIIWDGGFFNTPVTGEPLDGGEFADAVLYEYDCGAFVYPCTCIL